MPYSLRPRATVLSAGNPIFGKCIECCLTPLAAIWSHLNIRFVPLFRKSLFLGKSKSVGLEHPRQSILFIHTAHTAIKRNGLHGQKNQNTKLPTNNSPVREEINLNSAIAVIKACRHFHSLRQHVPLNLS